MSVRLLPLLGLSLVLASCDVAPEEAAPSFEPVPLATVCPDQIGNRFETLLRHISAFEDALSLGVPAHERWQDTDRALRELLDRPDSSLQERTRRNRAAVEMRLPGHILGAAPDSPEMRDALAFYATVLIETRSTQRAKIERVLRRLEGHWSPARLAEARRLADAHADPPYGCRRS